MNRHPPTTPDRAASGSNNRRQFASGSTRHPPILPSATGPPHMPVMNQHHVQQSQPFQHRQFPPQQFNSNSPVHPSNAPSTSYTPYDGHHGNMVPSPSAESARVLAHVGHTRIAQSQMVSAQSRALQARQAMQAQARAQQQSQPQAFHLQAHAHTQAYAQARMHQDQPLGHMDPRAYSSQVQPPPRVQPQVESRHGGDVAKVVSQPDGRETINTQTTNVALSPFIGGPNSSIMRDRVNAQYRYPTGLGNIGIQGPTGMEAVSKVKQEVALGNKGLGRRPIMGTGSSSTPGCANENDPVTNLRAAPPASTSETEIIANRGNRAPTGAHPDIGSSRRDDTRSNINDGRGDGGTTRKNQMYKNKPAAINIQTSKPTPPGSFLTGSRPASARVATPQTKQSSGSGWGTQRDKHHGTDEHNHKSFPSSTQGSAASDSSGKHTPDVNKTVSNINNSNNHSNKLLNNNNNDAPTQTNAHINSIIRRNIHDYNRLNLLPQNGFAVNNAQAERASSVVGPNLPRNPNLANTSSTYNRSTLHSSTQGTNSMSVTPEYNPLVDLMVVLKNLGLNIEVDVERSGGKDHEPVFRGEAVIHPGGLTVDGYGGSKNAGRKAAATETVNRLNDEKFRRIVASCSTAANAEEELKKYADERQACSRFQVALRAAYNFHRKVQNESASAMAAELSVGGLRDPNPPGQKNQNRNMTSLPSGSQSRQNGNTFQTYTDPGASSSRSGEIKRPSGAPLRAAENKGGLRGLRPANSELDERGVENRNVSTQPDPSRRVLHPGAYNMRNAANNTSKSLPATEGTGTAPARADNNNRTNTLTRERCDTDRRDAMGIDKQLHTNPGVPRLNDRGQGNQAEVVGATSTVPSSSQGNRLAMGQELNERQNNQGLIYPMDNQSSPNMNKRAPANNRSDWQSPTQVTNGGMHPRTGVATNNNSPAGRSGPAYSRDPRINRRLQNEKRDQEAKKSGVFENGRLKEPVEPRAAVIPKSIPFHRTHTVPNGQPATKEPTTGRAGDLKMRSAPEKTPVEQNGHELTLDTLGKRPKDLKRKTPGSPVLDSPHPSRPHDKSPLRSKLARLEMPPHAVTRKRVEEPEIDSHVMPVPPRKRAKTMAKELPVPLKMMIYAAASDEAAKRAIIQLSHSTLHVDLRVRLYCFGAQPMAGRYMNLNEQITAETVYITSGGDISTRIAYDVGTASQNVLVDRVDHITNMYPGALCTRMVVLSSSSAFDSLKDVNLINVVPSEPRSSPSGTESKGLVELATSLIEEARLDWAAHKTAIEARGLGNR